MYPMSVAEILQPIMARLHATISSNKKSIFHIHQNSPPHYPPHFPFNPVVTSPSPRPVHHASDVNRSIKYLVHPTRPSQIVPDLSSLDGHPTQLLKKNEQQTNEAFTIVCKAYSEQPCLQLK